MRSLLTTITESIGDSIARKSPDNELIIEKLHLDSNIKMKSNATIKMEEVSMKDLVTALKKDDQDLLGLLKDFIANNQTLNKKYGKKPAPARSSSSSSSSGGCGSSTRWGGGCGGGSYSRSSWGGGCGSSRSSGGC